MKIFLLTLIIFSLSLISCEKKEVENLEEKYVPTDVLVKVKGFHTIDKVFDFINSFDHEVETFILKHIHLIFPLIVYSMY